MTLGSTDTGKNTWIYGKYTGKIFQAVDMGYFSIYFNVFNFFNSTCTG